MEAQEFFVRRFLYGEKFVDVLASRDLASYLKGRGIGAAAKVRTLGQMPYVVAKHPTSGKWMELESVEDVDRFLADLDVVGPVIRLVKQEKTMEALSCPMVPTAWSVSDSGYLHGYLRTEMAEEKIVNQYGDVLTGEELLTRGIRDDFVWFYEIPSREIVSTLAGYGYAVETEDGPAADRIVWALVDHQGIPFLIRQSPDVASDDIARFIRGESECRFSGRWVAE